MVCQPHHLGNHVSHFISQLCIYVSIWCESVILFFQHNLFGQFADLLGKFNHCPFGFPFLLLNLIEALYDISCISEKVISLPSWILLMF